MVLLQSKSLPLGLSCPEFSLPSVIDDGVYSLKDYAQAKALLVAFICNHCPYVRAIEDRLIGLRKSFDSEQLAMVGICSNDAVRYPDDGKENLKKRWYEKNYGFPYLVDAEQTVARDFLAVCTPEFFLFDQKRKLFYHGQLDDNWQHEAAVKHHHLEEAIEAIIEGKVPPSHQQPSMGCSIKWK